VVIKDLSASIIGGRSHIFMWLDCPLHLFLSTKLQKWIIPNQSNIIFLSPLNLYKNIKINFNQNRQVRDLSRVHTIILGGIRIFSSLFCYVMLYMLLCIFNLFLVNTCIMAYISSSFIKSIWCWRNFPLNPTFFLFIIFLLILTAFTFFFLRQYIIYHYKNINVNLKKN